jgi:broad specificity phosphatase PhoE
VTTLLFVRHGETDWNAERRWQGHADQPLNDTGRAQARDAAALLAERTVDVVYASPLARAHETAVIIAEQLGRTVLIDGRLREVDVGDWSGRLHSDIEADGLETWNGGETYEEMADRVVPAVLDLANRHPGKTVLVVTHGGVIRACRARAARLGYDESREHFGSASNCDLIELHVADDGLVTPIG